MSIKNFIDRISFDLQDIPEANVFIEEAVGSQKGTVTLLNTLGVSVADALLSSATRGPGVGDQQLFDNKGVDRLWGEGPRIQSV